MDNTSKIPTQGHFSSVHNSVPRSSPAQDNAPTIMREESEESSPQTESTHTTFDRPRLGRDQNPHSPSQRQFHYFLVFSVQHIERSSVKNPIVQFDVKTNLPRFRAPHVRDVRRTHYELVKLQDHLIYANPECFVPSLPPPVTSAGPGTEEDQRRMKEALQRWFNAISSNPVLIKDEEMTLFVESDFGYSPVHDHGTPTAGLRRRAKKQFAPPPDDCAELAEARPVIKLFYLTTQDCHSKLRKLSKSRIILSHAEQVFSSQLRLVGLMEVRAGLSRAYRQLSKAYLQRADISSAQSIAELVTFADQLALLSQSAFIAKETLTTRHFLIREFINAQASSRSKNAALQRLKTATKIDEAKVDEALRSYEDAKAKETDLQHKVNRVTGNLLYEKRLWTQRIVKDAKWAIKDYAERMIEIERRTLGALEVVRPDIRSIDASGGLSWRGRKPHKSVVQSKPSAGHVDWRSRTSRLGPSQGPHGDAWSGIERASYRRVNAAISPSWKPEAIASKEDESDEGKLDARSAAMLLSAQL